MASTISAIMKALGKLRIKPKKTEADKKYMKLYKTLSDYIALPLSNKEQIIAVVRSKA